MSLFRQLGRAYLLNRLLRSNSRRHHRRHLPSRHYSRGPLMYGRHRRRGRGRTGFWGPFPYYSRQTRGGGRVSVGGCCLPIPLALVLGSVLAGRYAYGRRAAVNSSM